MLDDGIYETYTVFGFWFETMERWSEVYEADTPLHAEEMAQKFAREVKFMHLGVVAVVEGRVPAVDLYATHVDPHATSNEQMAMVMDELGLWKLGELANRKDKPAKRSWI